jgi:phage terminase large subunit-like protein
MSAADYRRDPVGFIAAFITKDEKGRPFRLSAYQRRVLERAFAWDSQGRLLVSVFLWGEMKKSGKTFLAAALALWWAFTNSNTEVLCAANDLDQSVGRVFKTIVQILRQNPALASSARMLAEEIQLSNGTSIRAIPSDYKGEAGSRHSLVIYDELWGYTMERAQRLFEELTPPPTEENAWVLIVTVAGWTAESVLLERLYKRGLAGERIDDELEVYRAGDLTMFWSHTPRQPWQTEQYYASQREILRHNNFARLHENRWVTNETAFITPELWDGAVDPQHQPLLPSKNETEFVAVDIGLKSDNAAVVRVRRRDHQIVLAGYRLWKPSRTEPLNLEETVEAYLREVCEQNFVRRIVIDPWQAARSIQTLKAAGLPIEEFPQTTANTTRMAQTLFDVLKGRNLVLFEDDDLRQQAMNTVAIETPRGFRIAKEKASKKIDAIVALSMACVAAVESGLPLRCWFCGKTGAEGCPGIHSAGELQDGQRLDDLMVTIGTQTVDPDIAELLGQHPQRIGAHRWRPL